MQFKHIKTDNSHVKKMGLKKSDTCVHTYITSKRIELESPCWSGFEVFRIFFKPVQPGVSSSIRLEVMCIGTQLFIPMRHMNVYESDDNLSL